MVTIALTKGSVKRSNGLGVFYDCRGLSTDTKPTDVPNGSSFAEMDTGKGYMFDSATSTWHEIPSGSSVVIPVATGVMF